MFRSRYWFYLPAISWASIIYFMSTTSSIPKIDFNLLSVDKIGHMVFYSILTLLLIFGAAKQKQWTSSNVMILGLMAILASAYGISLEYVQGLLPHRSFDTADMLANEVGVVIGLLIYIFTAQRFFLSKE
ncbi:MAG: hypothetical protein GY810_08395 [Aureispira sp.]|nr:hypothetical protein [Aureispira sp.]